MKLVTFATNQHQRFGIIIEHPKAAEFLTYNPEFTESKLHLYSSRFASSLRLRQPSFMGSLPKELTPLPAFFMQGMKALQDLEVYLKRFLALSNEGVLIGTSFRLSEVETRASSPRPKLYFNLVQNSPTFTQNNDELLNDSASGPAHICRVDKSESITR